MIEPFFFSNERLFGIYQASSGLANSAVVICPPAFDEYRRSYRALSSLATACSQLGYDVLRFDYRGTGDSKEGLQSIEHYSSWVDDISAAIDEIVDLSGHSSVKLVASRLGALLASNVEHRLVDQVIAWDPFLDGNEFIDVWNKQLTAEADRYKHYKRYLGHKKKVSSFAPFPLNENFLESLRTLKFGSGNFKTSAILSSAHSSSNFDSLADQVVQTNSQDCWSVFHEGLIYPREIMEGILKFLGRENV